MNPRTMIEDAYLGPEEERRFWHSLALKGLSIAERRLVELSPLKPGSSLLVVGCGSGRESLGLYKLGFRVTGLDLSLDLLRTARSQVEGRGRCVYVAGDAAGVPFQSQTFDGVLIFSQVLGHLPTPALRE